jgi:hypothetical protein
MKYAEEHDRDYGDLAGPASQDPDTNPRHRVMAALHTVGIAWTDECDTYWWARHPEEGRAVSPFFLKPVSARNWITTMQPAIELHCYMHLGRGVMGPIARWGSEAGVFTFQPLSNEFNRDT